jgi:hypothetical protein
VGGGFVHEHHWGVCGEGWREREAHTVVCKTAAGRRVGVGPHLSLGWSIYAARFSEFLTLADVDFQLQMEREFSFHLQLADVASQSLCKCTCVIQ